MTRHEQNREQTLDEREVIRRLRASARDDSATAEPPEGLLERLRADVPERLPANDADTAEGAPTRSPLSSPWLRLAALLALAVVGGWITFQLADRTGTGMEPAPRRDSATRAATPAERPTRDSSTPPGAEELAKDGLSNEDRRSAVETDGSAVTETLAEATPPPPPPSSGSESRSATGSLGSATAGETLQDSHAPVAPPDRSRAESRRLVEGGAAATPPPAPLRQAPPSPPPPARPETPVAEMVIPASPPAPTNERFERHNARMDDMAEEAAQLERRLEELEAGSVPKPAPRDQVRVEEEPTYRGGSPRVEADADAGRKKVADGEVAEERGSTTLPAPLPPPEPPRSVTPPPRWPVGPPPLTRTVEDAFSTFGLDVDTGSWSIARAQLRLGRWPQGSMIRPEEILNVFDYHDPAPRRETFGVTAELAPAPASITGASDLHLLRLGIKARELAPVERRPAALTFVVDVSGSMDRPRRLPLLKRSLGMLLDQLQPGDTVALVAYNTQPWLVLPHTGDVEAVRRALLELTPGGSTNADGGLQVGYREARRVYRPGRVNRVILASDGIANVGATTPEAILERVGRQASEGIELTTLGFGVDSYNDRLMEQLADRGDGRYAYLDSLEEAHRVLVEELTGTLHTVAEEARVQVEMAPGVRAWRLVGYDNRAIADQRFRWESEDAGEIGAGHAMTVLYELRLDPELAASLPRSATLAVLRVRWREPGSGEWRESQHRITGAALARNWQSAGPALRFAGIAARFAEALRYGPHSEAAAALPALLPEARQLVDRHWPRDPRRQELVELMGRVVEQTPLR